MVVGKRRETWTQTEVIQGHSVSARDSFTARKLFLGGTGDLVEKDLWDFLEAQYGPVDDVDVIRHYDQPRGFAFATFADTSSAAHCIREGSLYLHGYTISVSPSDKDASPRRRRAPKSPTSHDGDASEKKTVFLGGTRQLTESVLVRMLERWGEVASLHVMSRPENQLVCAGFAFATFSNPQDAQRIVNRGFITVANVTLEARFAADDSRPSVSQKVSLREADELVEGLTQEMMRVQTYAPGGHRKHECVVHEGIIFAQGTPFERVMSQQIDEREEPLDESCRSLSELHQLLEDALALRTQVYDCLGSRLRAAAEDNNVAAMRLLLSLGADVNAPQRLLRANVPDSTQSQTLGVYDEQAPRALYLAAAQGHEEACRVMLQEFDADAHLVCRGQDLEVLGSFVAYTPLKVAAERGFTQVVKMLLEHGADVNFSDDSRWTILHWAACNNHADVVLLLAAAGADINALNIHGRSPLALAVAAGSEEGADALRSVGAKLIEKVRGKKKKSLPVLKEAHTPHVE